LRPSQPGDPGRIAKHQQFVFQQTETEMFSVGDEKGLCSCRVRGVDGSCAKHLTVESYMVIYAANSYSYYFSFPSPSFISNLKPSFSANPSHCRLSFFFIRTDYMIPQSFTVTSEHIRFYL